MLENYHPVTQKLKRLSGIVPSEKDLACRSTGLYSKAQP